MFDEHGLNKMKKEVYTMVSMSKPQGVSQAQGYLAKENYYQKNSEIGKFLV